MAYTVSIDKIAKVTSGFNPKFIVINGLPGTRKLDVVKILNVNGDYNVIKFTGSWDAALEKIDKWVDDHHIILYGCFTNVTDLQTKLQDHTYTYMYTYPGAEFKLAIKNYTDTDRNLTGTGSPGEIIKLCKKMYSDSISEFDSRFVVIKT